MNSIRVAVESALLSLMDKSNGRLRPSNLIARLAKEAGLPKLDVRDALAALAQEEKLQGVTRSGEPVSFVTWVGERRVEFSNVQQMMQEVLARMQFTPDVSAHAALLDAADVLKGLAPNDVEALLHGLILCRDQHESCDPMLLSAEHLLGSSKAIGNLRRFTRALGYSVEDRSAEYYVLTAGPLHPKSVLLIENIRCFTAFAKSKHIRNILGVAAYGYGLTMESFGSRLAADQIIACPAYGKPVDLKRALGTLPIYFWGDLDNEGLRIFESLRTHLPNLQFSAAYEAMIERMADPHRTHPYHKLFKKERQRPPRGLTAEVNYLGRHCATRALDQEAFCKEIELLNLGAPYLKLQI